MFFKKKTNGESTVLKIGGMHCVSCAMNIDGALEDLEGVIESTTHYAKQITRVTYDPQRVNLETIKKEITKQEYSVLDTS